MAGGVASTLAFSPLGVLSWCLAVFVPCRLILGGAPYLPSKAWQALCIVIPGFVVFGLASGAFCVPLECDWATLFHVATTILYFQLDLSVGFAFMGSSYGQICVPWMVVKELSPFPSASSQSLSAKIKSKMPTPGFAKAPLFDFSIDLVSVTAHEIFWNVFICQNCLNFGMHPVVSILAVPAVSCLVHGIVSSADVGLRMFPQFLHVALAYHTSGSILPPALIHHFWYLLDQKPLAVVKQAKRDWDYEERRDETSLTPWDGYSTASLLLTLVFYIPLEFLVHKQPFLYSPGSALSVSASVCQGPWTLPQDPCTWVLIVLFSLRIAMLLKQWQLKRVAYDAFLGSSADGRESSQDKVAEAVLSHYMKQKGTPLLTSKDSDGE